MLSRTCGVGKVSAGRPLFIYFSSRLRRWQYRSRPLTCVPPNQPNHGDGLVAEAFHERQRCQDMRHSVCAGHHVPPSVGTLRTCRCVHPRSSTPSCASRKWKHICRGRHPRHLHQCPARKSSATRLATEAMAGVTARRPRTRRIRSVPVRTMPAVQGICARSNSSVHRVISNAAGWETAITFMQWEKY